MLALLNDGAILSIAYDKVRYRNQPEAWNMRVVLGMATVLGIVGPVAAFGVFFLGDRVFHLGRPELQTMMYLTLSVAGHLTIFQARTRGSFWSIRPARILWVAVLGTQILATCIAVFGIFMTPLGFGYAALVWGYALVWFLFTDRVKIWAYRILDPSSQSSVRDSRSGRTFADLGLMAASVAPFHTGLEVDSQDSVFHDSSSCQYAKEIMHEHHVVWGADERRRCSWCEDHAHVAPFHTEVRTGLEEPVFHDSTSCPYGQEITDNHHDHAGANGLRRCSWCELHVAALVST
jgi:H+-transporting ATPase